MGTRDVYWIRTSLYGEVYKAFDKASDDYVAIQKAQLIAADMDLEEELRLLNTYRSRYIAEYQDVIRVDNELWVRGVVICLGL